MATIFTKIIDGELPGRFVWQDEVCVGFLSIAPMTPGHTLVVPRVEIDHWLDLDQATVEHSMGVAYQLGKAIHHAFKTLRVGVIIAGMEVPHTHLHVLGMNAETDLDFRNARPSTTGEELDAAAEAIRASLDHLGIAPA